MEYINKLITATIISLLLSLPSQATIKQRVKLNVPLVKQGKALCGPATVEMLFRYWGVKKYNQYDIARAILNQFPQSKRFIKSGIFNTTPINWDKYPGTGTINMREFLKRFAPTYNYMLEHEPKSEIEKFAARESLFREIKQHLSNGVPAIVHQYWKLPKSTGHYRIVTGYDENKAEVYLNDADGGKRLVQSYNKFLRMWNFNQRWLHYNTIIFNIHRKQLNIVLIR